MESQPLTVSILNPAIRAVTFCFSNTIDPGLWSSVRCGSAVWGRERECVVRLDRGRCNHLLSNLVVLVKLGTHEGTRGVAAWIETLRDAV